MTANHPTPEELAELARLLTKFIPDYEPWMDTHEPTSQLYVHRTGNTLGDLKEAHALLSALASRALAEDLAERTHEPVAWMYGPPNRTSSVFLRERRNDLSCFGWTETALVPLAAYEEMRRENARTTEELEWYRERMVWGFYEEKVPSFTQGPSGANEITSPVTADEANAFVARATALSAENERLRAALEEIKALTDDNVYVHARAIARAALSSLATTPADDGWKTMESLPKDKLVWCFEPHSMGGFMFAGCLGEDGRWRNNLDGKVQHPTHWRDLPASPSDGEG